MGNFKVNPATGQYEWVEDNTLAPGLPPLQTPPAVDPQLTMPGFNLMNSLRNRQGEPEVPQGTPPSVPQQYQPPSDFKPLQGMDWSKVGSGAGPVSSSITPPPVQPPVQQPIIDQDLTSQRNLSQPIVDQDTSQVRNQVQEQQLNQPVPPVEKSWWERMKEKAGSEQGLQSMKDIAQGLDQMKPITGSMIRAGLVPKPGLMATPGLDEALAKKKDELTPEMRAEIEKSLPGVKLPENMPLSKLKELGIITQQMETQRAGIAAKERQATQANVDRRHQESMAATKAVREDAQSEATKRQEDRQVEAKSQHVISERDKLHNKIVTGNTPLLKKQAERQTALDIVKDNLKSNDVTMEQWGNIQTQLPKIEGDVGNIALQERKISLGYAGAQGLVDQISTWIHSAPPATKVKRLRDLVNGLQEVVDKTKKEVSHNEIKSFVGRYKDNLKKEYNTEDDNEILQQEFERAGVEQPGSDLIGKEMMYQGKKVKVNKVYPDGSFDYDEVK